MTWGVVSLYISYFNVGISVPSFAGITKKKKKNGTIESGEPADNRFIIFYVVEYFIREILIQKIMQLAIFQI